LHDGLDLDAAELADLVVAEGARRRQRVGLRLALALTDEERGLALAFVAGAGPPRGIAVRDRECRFRPTAATAAPAASDQHETRQA
jgi:hypothetical protein